MCSVAVVSLSLPVTRSNSDFFVVIKSSGDYLLVLEDFLPCLPARLCARLGAKAILAAKVMVLVQIQLEFFSWLLLTGFQGC